MSAQPVLPTIVVIDDDPDVCMGLRLAFERAYVIKDYTNPATGVDAVNASVSAIILDIKMPARDGFAIYEDIRQKNEDIPIVFYSAYQNVRNPFEIINKYRPFGYVFKGGDLVELSTLLASAVRHNERLKNFRQLAEEMSAVQERMLDLARRPGTK